MENDDFTEITTARFLVGCKSRDISLKDMDALNINTLFEMINYYDYISYPDQFEGYEKPKDKKYATQSEIDSFFG